jgi:hypothetical protein
MHDRTAHAALRAARSRCPWSSTPRAYAPRSRRADALQALQPLVLLVLVERAVAQACAEVHGPGAQLGRLRGRGRFGSSGLLRALQTMGPYDRGGAP